MFTSHTHTRLRTHIEAKNGAVVSQTPCWPPTHLQQPARLFRAHDGEPNRPRDRFLIFWQTYTTSHLWTWTAHAPQCPPKPRLAKQQQQQQSTTQRSEHRSLWTRTCTLTASRPVVLSQRQTNNSYILSRGSVTCEGRVYGSQV